MKEKETARRKSLADTRESLGLSQAFELGKRSTEEFVLRFSGQALVSCTDHSLSRRAKIVSLEAEIQALARKLDVTLSRPPSQREERKNGDVKDE